MRLRSPSDKIQALSELGLPVTSNVELTPQHFIQIIEARPDWRKSKDQKARWRRNRRTYMKGIKKFHKSTEGKKFHRQLGRYIATRMTNSENLNEISSTVDDFLTAVSSIRTHLYIDLGYYKPILEEFEYSDLLEEIIPVLNEIELKFIKRNYQDLTPEELNTLLSLISPDVLEDIFEIKVDDKLFDSELYLAKLILDK